MTDSNKEFISFLDSHIRRFLSICGDLPYCIMFYSLFTGLDTSRLTTMNAVIRRFEAYYTESTKEKLGKKINPDFRKAVEMLMQRPKLKDFMKAFPSYEDIWILTDNDPEDSEETALINQDIQAIYYSLYVTPVIPSPCKAPEDGVITFSDQAEDAVKLAESVTNGNYKGKTVQTHLMAEDYGFDKDELFAIMVDNHAPYRTTAKMLPETIQSWMDWEYDTMAAECYLKWMKPRNVYSFYGYSSSSLRLDKYYKKALLQMLGSLECGLWYSKDDLWESYKASYQPIYISNTEKDMWDFFPSFRPLGFSDNIEDGGNPLKSRTDELIRRPVFEAMLYTLALFGAVDITEKEPELTVRKSARKLVPYSPFDCIDRITVTAFGRWVLGLSETKPAIEHVFEEPILDKSLLLITYKGRDVMLRSFLSEIAEPVGTIRYKVTLKSFTANPT